MKHISKIKIQNIFILTLFSFSYLFANIQSGDTLPPLHLVDQFDKKLQINDNAILICSFQKSVSSKIQAYIATKPKHYIEDNHILYIADMSAAPTFMIKLFGIPKMKKFDYRVGLIYDDAIADNIQREDDKVTVITLNKGWVVGIRFVDVKELGRVLER